jgi:hypothetical protein
MPLSYPRGNSPRPHPRPRPGFPVYITNYSLLPPNPYHPAKLANALLKFFHESCRNRYVQEMAKEKMVIGNNSQEKTAAQE